MQEGNIVATYQYENGTDYIMDSALPETDEENELRWERINRTVLRLLREIQNGENNE